MHLGLFDLPRKRGISSAIRPKELVTKGSETSAMNTAMDKKRLEQFKKRLEDRQVELRKMVSNRQQDGRNLGEDVAQDIADRAATSYNKEFLFTQSTNE